MKHRMAAPKTGGAARVAVANANRKLRTLAFQLNPPMLDQLGFQRALEWMGDEMNRLFKLDVHIVDDGTPKPMDPAVSATLFRAVRELLINVAKHAGVNSDGDHRQAASAIPLWSPSAMRAPASNPTRGRLKTGSAASAC